MLHTLKRSSSQTQLGSPPVSPLGVVPDLITSFHSNPLENWTILFLFLGQESLDAEGFVRSHGEEGSETVSIVKDRGLVFPTTGALCLWAGSGYSVQPRGSSLPVEQRGQACFIGNK